jgi:sortase A
MSLLLVGIGLAVAVTFFAGSPVRDAGAADNPQQVSRTSVDRPNVPVVSPEVDESLEKKQPEGAAREDKEGGQAPKQAPEQAPKPAAVEGPEDESLKVTIPAMSRVRGANVPYADGGNEEAFKKYAGVHLRGTGHPWQKEANVYIAGHRLGYPATDSWLAFWDLNRVGEGDRIFLTDADGKKYVYKVFRTFVVEPTQVSVTRPLEGRNIVTLQTCTLPDYSDRLIVQAEKVA